jgi:hypothetical protein
MLNSDEMQLCMERIARNIMVSAIRMAPIGDEQTDPHAGRYAGSFHMRSHKHGGATKDRAEAVVYNGSPEAAFVEWGHAGKEPYHTLWRAASEGHGL